MPRRFRFRLSEETKGFLWLLAFIATIGIIVWIAAPYLGIRR